MRLSPALRRDHRVTEPRRPEQYLRGQLPAATALTEKGPSAADHPVKQGQVRFAMFNDPRNSTGHLGGDWAIRFAAQMFVVAVFGDRARSEEHTSELQSLAYLVCRLLLEKKKKNNIKKKKKKTVKRMQCIENIASVTKLKKKHK